MIQRFAFFSFLIIMPYLCSLIASSEKSGEWLDKNSVQELKGLAILSVIWSHVGAMMCIQHIQYIASIGVSLFLTCSGYGLQISSDNNGLRHFWKKRIIRVYVPFVFVEVIHLCVVGQISVESVWNILVGFFGLTDYRWFIGFIFICYMIFWMVKSIVSEKYQMVLLWVCFFIWYLVDSMWFSIPGMEFLRARQMLAFPLGVYLAKHKMDLRKIAENKKEVIKYGSGCLLISLLSGVVMLYLRTKGVAIVISNGFALFQSIPIALLIIMLTTTWKKMIHNRYLRFCGTISFELYLCHIWEVALFVRAWAYSEVCIYLVVLFFTAWLLWFAEKCSTRKMNGLFMS